MNERTKFSERYGYASTDAEIIVQHDDAPYELRGIILDIAYEQGLSPSPMRDLICRKLRKRPDPNNWSEYPNILHEVAYLVDNCEWFEVYEIIEEIYQELLLKDGQSAEKLAKPHREQFSEELNRYLRKPGIGWQLINGQLQIRGSESFEDAVRNAQEVLEANGRNTARGEVHQALLDLSRRSNPDITGAIQHAMAALECVACDVSGNPKSTLGEILKKQPGLLPRPLDQAVEKAWGYSSERGRHLREGDNPDMNEATLIVGITAVLVTYLSSKAKAV